MKIPVLKMKYKQPESIRSVFHESAEKYGNKIAYKYFNNKNEVVEMTYKQLYSSFKYIGSILCELGLQKKKIAVIGENRPEWIIAYSAIMSIGSIVIPLDKELLEPQIEGFLNASEADAVFCSGKFAEKIQNMNLDKLQFIFDFDNSPSADKRCVAYSKLLSDGSRLVSDGLSKFNQVRYDRSKMSALIFTSGTTGTSKGVMLSEDNVLTALNAATNMIDLKSDNVLLSVLPMHPPANRFGKNSKTAF